MENSAEYVRRRSTWIACLVSIFAVAGCGRPAELEIESAVRQAIGGVAGPITTVEKTRINRGPTWVYRVLAVVDARDSEGAVVEKGEATQQLLVVVAYQQIDDKWAFNVTFDRMPFRRDTG